MLGLLWLLIVTNFSPPPGQMIHELVSRRSAFLLLRLLGELLLGLAMEPMSDISAHINKTRIRLA
jgi:hypothetical protein